MKRLMKLLLGTVLVVLVTASCSYQDMMDKLVPKEESGIAEDYLAKIRARDFDYVKSKLSDELKSKVTDELLVAAADEFRSGDLVSSEVIGAQVHVFNGIWQGNFTYEYHFSGGWNLANVAFRKVNDDYEVIGFHVYQTEMSQKELNAFNLEDKSPLHYLILVLAVCVPLFILVTTYFCVRTPIPKRKWLWVLFVLSGIAAFKINWTTGAYAFQLLSINFLGATAMYSGPYAPLVVSVSLPLGAIVFWIKRKSFIQLSEEVGDSPESGDPDEVRQG